MPHLGIILVAHRRHTVCQIKFQVKTSYTYMSRTITFGYVRSESRHTQAPRNTLKVHITCLLQGTHLNVHDISFYVHSVKQIRLRVELLSTLDASSGKGASP